MAISRITRSPSLSPKPTTQLTVSSSVIKFNQQTVQFNFLNAKTYVDLFIKPKAEETYSALKTSFSDPFYIQLLHSNFESYDKKCSQISRGDCQRLCNQNNGILRIIEPEIVCTFFKIAVSVCFEVDFSLRQPALIGGCFPDNSYVFYESLVLNKKYSLKDIVS